MPPFPLKGKPNFTLPNVSQPCFIPEFEEAVLFPQVRVAKLADALDLGSSGRKAVRVQVPPRTLFEITRKPTNPPTRRSFA